MNRAGVIPVDLAGAEPWVWGRDRARRASVFRLAAGRKTRVALTAGRDEYGTPILRTPRVRGPARARPAPGPVVCCTRYVDHEALPASMPDGSPSAAPSRGPPSSGEEDEGGDPDLPPGPLNRNVSCLLTVAQACSYLGVSRRHFYRHIRRKVPVVDLGGQLVRIDKEDLQKWVEKQKRGSSDVTPARGSTRYASGKAADASTDPLVAAELARLQRLRRRSTARSPRRPGKVLGIVPPEPET